LSSSNSHSPRQQYADFHSWP